MKYLAFFLSLNALLLNIATSLTLLPGAWRKDLVTGFRQRCAADPNFPLKSLTEVFLAATTQLAAEYQRRGGTNDLVRQADFVVAGVLTAMYGKYASMWKVAATTTTNEESIENENEPRFGHIQVPTNAFQKYLLDGVTPVTTKQRLGSLIVPMVPLFRAGVLASLVGYGMTACLIALRSYLIPSYVAATINVNILHASVYTGCFMAAVSNVRYQIVQGVIEPTITRIFARIPLVQAILFFAIRVVNGLLGSILAISGMRILGLQRLKET